MVRGTLGARGGTGSSPFLAWMCVPALAVWLGKGHFASIRGHLGPCRKHLLVSFTCSHFIGEDLPMQSFAWTGVGLFVCLLMLTC